MTGRPPASLPKKTPPPASNLTSPEVNRYLAGKSRFHQGTLDLTSGSPFSHGFFSRWEVLCALHLDYRVGLQRLRAT